MREFIDYRHSRRNWPLIPREPDAKRCSMTAHRSLMLAVFLTVAPFVGGPVVAAQCDSCVLDFTDASAFRPFTADSTVGWKFTVAPGSTITIGGLGVFDFGSNGLMESHQIGLWNNDGSSLLASATIKADGSNSTPVASNSSAGQWLFTPITSSVDLTPGAYVVGAFYMANSKDSFMTTSSPTTIQGVTFNEARASFTSDLQFPGFFNTEGPAGFFGPNLSTAAAPPVPEPETYAMLTAGLGLLSFIARRRKKSLNAAA